MTNIGTIELLGILAVGRHGVLAEEQRRGQPFEVDVRLDLDLDPAALTDEILDTVDYGLLAEAVVRIVEFESFQLLERLADRIASICLASGDVRSAEVTVRKLRPPVPVQVRSVGVTVRRDAGETRADMIDEGPAATEADEAGHAHDEPLGADDVSEEPHPETAVGPEPTPG